MSGSFSMTQGRGDTRERTKRSISFMSAMILPVQLRGLLVNVLLAAESLSCDGRRSACMRSQTGCRCRYSSLAPSVTGNSILRFSSTLVQRCRGPSQEHKHPQRLMIPQIIICRDMRSLHTDMYIICNYAEYVHVASCQQKGSNAASQPIGSDQAMTYFE
jgi:hypothetical protein